MMSPRQSSGSRHVSACRRTTSAHFNPRTRSRSASLSAQADSLANVNEHVTSLSERRQARAARRSRLALLRSVLRALCEFGQVEAQKVDREAKTEFQRLVGHGVIAKRSWQQQTRHPRPARPLQAPPPPRRSDLLAPMLTAAPCAPPAVLESARRELTAVA
jgi:hypothetical protein